MLQQAAARAEERSVAVAAEAAARAAAVEKEAKRANAAALKADRRQAEASATVHTLADSLQQLTSTVNQLGRLTVEANRGRGQVRLRDESAVEEVDEDSAVLADVDEAIWCALQPTRAANAALAACLAPSVAACPPPPFALGASSPLSTVSSTSWKAFGGSFILPSHSTSAAI